MAQDGSKRAPEKAKMASEIAQDSPTWFKIIFGPPPRALKTGPGRLQVPSEPPKEALKMPNAFKNIVFFFNVFLNSRLFASDGFLRPQDGSKMAQEGFNGRPRRVPRRPLTRPRPPKSVPNRPQEAHSGSDGGAVIEYPPSLTDGVQDGPKRAAKASHTG